MSDQEIEAAAKRTKRWCERLSAGRPEEHEYHENVGMHQIDEARLIDWAVARLAADRAERNDSFCIAPLKWELARKNCHRATTPFGMYYVERRNGGWHWSYCFDEFYDEGDDKCRSLEDGKAKAWAHWQERIKGALIGVEQEGGACQVSPESSRACEHGTKGCNVQHERKDGA